MPVRATRITSIRTARGAALGGRGRRSSELLAAHIASPQFEPRIHFSVDAGPLGPPPRNEWSTILMTQRTIAAVLLVFVVLAGAVGLGVGAYNAGVAAGVAQTGTAVVAPGAAVVPYGWGYGHGFGFFGFLGGLFFLFLLFA